MIRYGDEFSRYKVLQSQAKTAYLQAVQITLVTCRRSDLGLTLTAMRPLAAFTLVVSLLLLQGCAQYWTDASGGQRGRMEFIADSKQCELEVFGTTSWSEAHNNSLSKFSSGRKGQTDYLLEYEHYATCLERAGWIVSKPESVRAAPGAV
jgi:hypothetical protein